MSKDYARVTLTIRRDQRQWLANQPALNLSGLVQQIINEEKTRPRPFRYAGKRANNGKCVAATATIDPTDKEWLDNLREKSPHKHFLSYYVQRRLDYIMKTGIISASVEFRDSLADNE